MKSNHPAFYDDDDDDDVDYTIAITPVLFTEEPDNSLSMGGEHLDTIPATESDEVIKSSVEDLVLIPNESKCIPDTMCDVHFVNNPTPLEAKDHYEIVINFKDDISSSDDDSLYNENIEYVEASPYDSEVVSLEVAEKVIPKDKEIEDDNLRKKLLNVHLLIANIEALKDNPASSSEFLTKSSSTSPKSFLEESNTFHNSLAEFENFCFDLEEISSGSTTTHSDISLLDYEAFCFDDDHIEEISSGSTTTHYDISLFEYDSFIFDFSDDQFPLTDRSDFAHEEFADELAHIISLPEYDCFYFRNLPDSDEHRFYFRVGNSPCSSNSNQTHLQPRLRLLRKSVLPAEVLIRTTSVLPLVVPLSQNSGTTSKVTFQQPQATTIRGELKAITNCSGLVTDGPTVPTPPKSVNLEEDECVEETYTDPDLAEYTIKVPAPPKDDIQIQKFWNMFKQLHLNITLAEALVLMPKYQKMLKALLSKKEKLQELANTPLNKNCSAVRLKKLPEKLGDPGKFLISCGFSELKCKALADLGASINLMPLSVWKKLGLPDLIPTLMTLELTNRAICTPDGIARDVFVPVGKFTFPADFVVVDYESDPRVPIILGRPFSRTARALIDVHSEEMILRNGDERLTLNMKHDTANYSNHPHRDSVNLINIFNLSSEDCLEDLVSNKKSNIDSFNDIHPHFDDDPLSGSTTFSANSLLEEFTDELALITYPLDYDDNRTCDIESDLREIEFLLYQGKNSDLKDSIDQSDLVNLDDLFVDPTPEMFTDEQPPDYSFPSRFNVYPDDFLEIESNATNFDDDLFDSKGEKIKEAELLIDQLDLPCDILSEYDSFNSQDFSRDDDLPSPDNEDKIFNP
nr:hypothetical protein [Tanacetum cinerariifolium]